MVKKVFNCPGVVSGSITSLQFLIDSNRLPVPALGKLNDTCTVPQQVHKQVN